MSIWTQAILLGLIAGVISYLNNGLLVRTQLEVPLVIGPLVGLVMGDLQQGILLGAATQLLYIGSFAVGNALPPHVGVGSTLSIAFAIKMGMGAEAALVLALPISVVAGTMQTIALSFVSIPTRMIDDAAAEGNTRKISTIFWITGIIAHGLLYFVIVVFGYALGADAVQAAINKIPDFVLHGLQAASGIIPAVGIGLLLRMTYKNYLVPWFFAGYVLAAYLKVPILGIVILGLVVVAIRLRDSMGSGRTAATAQNVEVDDDEF